MRPPGECPGCEGFPGEPPCRPFPWSRSPVGCSSAGCTALSLHQPWTRGGTEASRADRAAPGLAPLRVLPARRFLRASTPPPHRGVTATGGCERHLLLSGGSAGVRPASERRAVAVGCGPPPACAQSCPTTAGARRQSAAGGRGGPCRCLDEGREPRRKGGVACPGSRAGDWQSRDDAFGPEAGSRRVAPLQFVWPRLWRSWLLPV